MEKNDIINNLKIIFLKMKHINDVDELFKIYPIDEPDFILAEHYLLCRNYNILPVEDLLESLWENYHIVFKYYNRDEKELYAYLEYETLSGITCQWK